VNDTASTQSATAVSVNWRGIAWFLVICHGLTWSIEITALARGIRFATLTPGTVTLLALVMWIPATSTFIVRRWITHEGFASANLRIGPLKPYLYIMLALPCLFLAIHALTCALGLGTFTTDPSALLKSLPPLPPGKKIPSAPVLFAMTGFISLIAGPLINLITTFGEEFGWTGYLLPSLLPLGRFRAVAIYGAIWGLWHAPIIVGGFHYAGHPIAGVLFFCAFTTAIGLIQCTLLLRYRSVLLTSFFHAAINAEANGIWLLLVIGVSSLWGGTVGLVGILVFGIVGSWLLSQTKENPVGPFNAEAVVPSSVQ
jgi:membrane protease YdiL (CAAX protease family)